MGHLWRIVLFVVLFLGMLVHSDESSEMDSDVVPEFSDDVYVEDDEGEEFEEEVEIEEEEPQLLYHLILPEWADGRIPSGEVVDALVSIQNEDSVAYNVSVLRGYMVDPHDFSSIIQNFTGMMYNEFLHPSDELSLHYRFAVDPFFESRVYGFVFLLVFEDVEGQKFVSEAHNTTWELFEKHSSVDWVNIAQKFVTTCTILGVGYVLFLVLSPRKVFDYQVKKEKTQKQQGKGNAPSEVGTEGAGIRTEFIPPHVKKAHERGRK